MLWEEKCFFPCLDPSHRCMRRTRPFSSLHVSEMLFCCLCQAKQTKSLIAVQHIQNRLQLSSDSIFNNSVFSVSWSCILLSEWLSNISDTYLNSSLCWFLADTFVRHVTGPIKPTLEVDWTWPFSHPHTVLSIRVFHFPVIWLAWTPVLLTKVESTKTYGRLSFFKQTNKKQVHNMQTSARAVLRPPTATCPPSLCPSGRSRTCLHLSSSCLSHCSPGISAQGCESSCQVMHTHLEVMFVQVLISLGHSQEIESGQLDLFIVIYWRCFPGYPSRMQPSSIRGRTSLKTRGPVDLISFPSDPDVKDEAVWTVWRTCSSALPMRTRSPPRCMHSVLASSQVEVVLEK